MHTDTAWQTVLIALQPLEAQLDAALANGDVAAAVRLAFGAAEEAVRQVGDDRSGMLHQVYVELTPRPLAAFEDGTLGDNGAYVNLKYQGWCVAPDEAEQLAAEWGNPGHWALDSS
jgi:hypothetical protein